MLTHLSFSQIRTYILCPLKYRFQYIDKLEWPFTPSSLLFGSCLHTALEHHYLGLQEGRRAPADELMAVFEGTWQKEQKGRPIYFGNSESEKKLFPIAKTLLEKQEKRELQGKILAVEKDFEVDIGNRETGETLALPLKGKIDLVVRNLDSSLLIIDHKTAARRYTNGTVEQDLQMTCYAYVFYHYKLQQPVTCRFDVFLKNKKPDICTYPTERTPEHFLTLFHTIQNVLRGIEHQVFYPNRCFLCSDCVFQDPCKNWKG